MNERATGSMPNHESRSTEADTVLRRAALVLVSLDDVQASQLLAKMSPRQVEAITAAIENLHEIDPAEQAEALNEFYQRMGLDQPGRGEAVSPGPFVTTTELADDLREWPAEALRIAFDPDAANDWALALADSEQDQLRRVLKALPLADRRLVAEADRTRGPWKLHEPHEARQRIRARFVAPHISAI